MVFFLGGNTIKTEYYLKNIHKCDKQKNVQLTILSKSLTYISNSESRFVWCHAFFKELWWLFGWFLGWQNHKTEHNLKNIHKFDKKNLNHNFSKTLTCFLNSESKLVWCHILFKELWWFFGLFWRCENCQKEHNHKTIRKSQKHILTNHFVGNLNIYSKRPQQIWMISHPFKVHVTISECSFFLSLGLGFLFKFAHKFTSLKYHNITIKLCEQKR